MTEIRANDLPHEIVDNTKIMYGDQEITSICVAADPEAGWADVVILLQEREVLRDLSKKEIMPLTARITGPIQVIYYGNHNHR